MKPLEVKPNPRDDRKRVLNILLIVFGVVVLGHSVFLTLRTREQSRIIARLEDSIRGLSQIGMGDSLPAVMALDIDSTLVPLYDLEPKALHLVLVFTTWCDACRMTTPEWNQLVANMSGERLHIIGLSSDPPHILKAFVRAHDIVFPVFSVSHNFEIMKRYKLLSFPTGILIDGSGNVLNTWNGLIDSGRRVSMEETLHQAIKSGRADESRAF